MRTLIGFGISALVLISCGTKEEELKQEQEIVRNCTGTYLNISGKNYLICNPEAVESYESGDKVLLDYEEINDCDYQSETPICLMGFSHEGIVTIQ
ncbi:MAG: hypothetical protein MI810_17270 [Flavobacteriales bacterium]|nr:hypothetical protein [Flavobacteriales bacterium]